MIKRTQMRHVALLVLTLLCSGGMLLACVPNKAATPGEVDEVEVKAANTLEAFEEEYAAIRRKVEEGSLPSEIMSRATEIRIGLQKYLIKTEAELEILRLDVLHGADAQRETALKQMVEIVEQREQTKIYYLQELQAIRGESKTSEDNSGQRRTLKDTDIEITIAPEDIGDGKRP